MKYYLAPDSAYIQHHIQHHIWKYKKISILVPFWATIDHKNIFTQDKLHTSFISKTIVLSIADAIRNIYFLLHF